MPWARRGNKLHSTICIVLLTVSRNAWLQQQKCSGAFSGPCRDKKSDGLKHIDCQVFLQQRWAYSGSAGKYSSGSATVVSHVEFQHSEGKRALLWRRGRWGLWKTVCGCALAKSLPQRKVLFLLGSAIVAGQESSRSGLPDLVKVSAH